MTPQDPTTFPELTTADWWQRAASSAAQMINERHDDHVLVLYNADVDGFAASYFAIRILTQLPEEDAVGISTRAVWNYEYDFAWLPKFVDSSGAPLLMCFDVPVIQEPAIIEQVVKRHAVLIYDHHVPPRRRPRASADLLYLNSRDLDSDRTNHPASAFLAALAEKVCRIESNEYLVAAMGLIGDHALSSYPTLCSRLERDNSALLLGPTPRETRLGSFTSKVNALFRAFPGREQMGLHEALHQFVISLPGEQALDRFEEKYDLRLAADKVHNEVSQCIAQLSTSSQRYIDEDILIALPDFDTFSVGIVATVLAKQGVAPIVAVGYQSGDRIQFELRSAESSGIDLTKLLRLQRRWYQPITSGGHPMAAGALIPASDQDRFAASLRAAAGTLKKR